jgi:hypothetical protein
MTKLEANLKAILVAGLVAGLLMSAGLLSSRIGNSSTVPSAAPTFEDADGLTGRAVIEALELEPLTYPIRGCDKLAAEGDVGYCLDGVTDSSYEAMILAMQIRGEIPNEQDKARFSKMAEIEAMIDAGMTSDDPEFRKATTEFWAEQNRVKLSDSYPSP